jgi:DNA protecting protein DprA
MSTIHYLQLQAASGLGPSAQRSVLQYVDRHNIALDEFLLADVKIWREAGLSSKQVDALDGTVAVQTAQTWQDELQTRNIQILSCLDEKYPQRLKTTLQQHIPPILYYWGNIDLLNKPAVGFCGSRDSTQKGVMVARDTAEQVAAKNWVVVSGHARGIDITTHLAALQNEGSTVIVIPEGFFSFRLRDELRPLVNRENTLVISEFQPNSKWSVANAMTRNHTICGLSDALMVIQAGLTGGTFEAGKFALRVNVPLFIAEYDSPEADGLGNPYFIQAGAKAIRRNRMTERANLEHLFAEVSSHHNNLANLTTDVETTVQKGLFDGELF